MTDYDRTLLAAFFTQRHEMGERELCVDPVVLNALLSPKKPASRTVERSPYTAPIEAPVRPLPDTHGNPRKEGTPATKAEKPGHSLPESVPLSDSLAELNGAVCDCQRCQLGETRIRFVFGEGNPDADIMFIGEAPGADEDQQGRPFVGRAGQLLTKMIESIKLRREDVFIANILKCRPPGNRDPRPEEIAQCEPILLRQIELIKPKIICALGRISGQTLLRTNATLGSLRGHVHDYHGVKLIVTYHPAALLRNQQWKRPAWDDLKFLRHEYDGLEL